MSVTLPLHPAAAASLVAWHQLVASREPQKLPPLLHPDAMFRSPMAFKPSQGAMIVAVVLRTALATFEDFRYHRELASADGLNVMLEFRRVLFRSLAWLLRRSPNILLIPGTSSVTHLRENLAVAQLTLPPEAMAALDGITA